MENIRGEFKINLAGQDRVLKANFDAIERLETEVFKDGIFVALTSAVQGKPRISDIVSVIYIGLICNKDTRLSRAQVGQAITEEGIVKFAEVYISFLNYCVTGGQEGKGGSTGESAAPDSQ